MTETNNGSGDATKAAEGANGAAANADPGKIRRQVEHYFGDYNLPRDTFLLDTIKDGEDGWVELDTMFKFARLAKLTTDAAAVMEALKESELMEVDAEKKRIRRVPSKPVPEWNEERKKELSAASVYAKGFDKDNTTLDELLENLTYDGLINIQLRTYLNKKDNSRGFKGSVFMTFQDRAAAEAFMALEKVEYKGVELERKFQDDYIEGKKTEFEDRKKEKHDAKKKIKDAKEAAKADAKKEEPEEEFKLPKGATLVMEGLNSETMREDLKSRLTELYEIENDDIAFVYYQKGEETAKLRFKEENAAVELMKKIGEDAKVEVKGAEAKVHVLEGEEEEAFLKKCVEDMADRRSQKGHKRKGGRGGFRGGRGAKRGRRN